MIDHDEARHMHKDQIDFLQGVIASYMDLNEWAPSVTKNNRKRVRDLKAKAEKTVAKRHEASAD